MRIIIVLVSMVAIGTCVRPRRVKRGWMSGTRPPGTKCAFHPCSVENFCGEGRTCELDNNCVHHCKCDERSTHESCETSDYSTDATQTVTSTIQTPLNCAFDVCKHAFTCSGNRKCVLDVFCHPKCECTDDSTHESCSQVTKETTSNPRTDGDGGCSSVCVHGVCVQTEHAPICKCETDWTGDQCDTRVCSLTCDDGSYCALLDGDVEQCMPLSEQPPPDHQATPTPTPVTKMNACSDDYKPRNAMCSKGMPCKYGYCEDDGTGETRCRCDAGAKDPLCSTLCCRECGPYGVCTINSEDAEVCNCHVNYTGVNCTELKPEEVPLTQMLKPTWYLWVVGGSVFVLVLLLVSLVLVPYLLWRHRVILVMKIVHYFQGYEDEDERQWDAFVSYRASDEDESFVVRTLLPELEKRRGFSLNVHFRDFIPGEAIANNIINAVQGSRRTILIISPEFVQSEFTRYEYEKAREEMLTRKHRIIPILLKDISHIEGQLDQTLKDILSSVTYIEWPHCGTQKKVDKFWKRLELSLPKKKQQHQHQHLNGGQELNQNNVVPDEVTVEVRKETSNDVYYTIPLDGEYLELDPEYDTINDVSRT